MEDQLSRIAAALTVLCVCASTYGETADSETYYVMVQIHGCLFAL